MDANVREARRASVTEEHRAYIAAIRASSPKPPSEPRRGGVKGSHGELVRGALQNQGAMFREQHGVSKRWDVAAMLWVTSMGITVYEMGSSFFWAHAFGVVASTTRSTRFAQCKGCVHRKIIHGHPRCSASGCNCSIKPWWVFSRLAWQLRLRNWPCPAGKFSRGLYSPADWLGLLLVAELYAIAVVMCIS